MTYQNETNVIMKLSNLRPYQHIRVRQVFGFKSISGVTSRTMRRSRKQHSQNIINLYADYYGDTYKF